MQNDALLDNMMISYVDAEVAIRIGRGVIPRPARSPEFTSLDFSVYSFVKDEVYHQSVPLSNSEFKS